MFMCERDTYIPHMRLQYYFHLRVTICCAVRRLLAFGFKNVMLYAHAKALSFPLYKITVLNHFYFIMQYSDLDISLWIPVSRRTYIDFLIPTLAGVDLNSEA